MFSKGHVNFCSLLAAFSFLTLESTNKLSNGYSYMLEWGLIDKLLLLGKRIFEGGNSWICDMQFQGLHTNRHLSSI